MIARAVKIALLAVPAVLVVEAVVALGWIYSGAYDVSATAEDAAFTTWLLTTTKERSIAKRADEVPEPPQLDSSSIAHGFEHYRAMCVTCHGAPGVARDESGEGLTPEPPDLAEEARERGARDLFWVTKHGIKMTGMPAFGPTHSDEQIWGIVGFVEQLAEMSPEDYAQWESRFTAATDGDAGEGAGGHVDPPGAAPHTH